MVLISILSSLTQPKNNTLFKGKTVDEIFIANTTVYKFCGAEILPSFSCHDVVKNADVENDLSRIKQHLNRVFDTGTP